MGRVKTRPYDAQISNILYLQVEESVLTQILRHLARRQHTSRSRGIGLRQFLVRYTVSPLPHQTRFAGLWRGPQELGSSQNVPPFCLITG